LRLWIDRAVHAVCAQGLVLAVTASVAASQEGIFERLALDRLRLTTLGVEYGPVKPARVEGTSAYAIQADYGEIAQNWRVVFTVTYWGSEFNARTISRFERQLAAAIDDPTADATVRIGEVSISDIALETDIRWTPLRLGVLRPFVGTGFGGHVVNADNKVINGTFIESGLDQITTGFTLIAGGEIPLTRISIGAQARYTLISTVRFGTVRGFITYRFARQQRASGS